MSAYCVEIGNCRVGKQRNPLRSVVFSPLAAVLISIATLHMLNQPQYYVDYSEDAKQLLGDVITQVPHLKQVTLFLVLCTG